MRKTLLTSLCAALIAVSSAFAQEDLSQGVPSNFPRRPKIGLALGGGGAKGMSQVGVLKVMAEVGIPIDYISGTSIGSIMGAMTALGYSADQLDSIVRNIDWAQYMRDDVPDKYLSYQAREDKSKYLLTIPFSTDRTLRQGINKITGREDIKKISVLSTLPAGLVSGNSIMNLLNTLAVGYQDSLNFIKDLPIPFSCVAINLVDGSQEVITSGKLPYAIRSSMAIPGVFPPVRSKGKVLIDGGMVNNFPVDVCRQMGADIVIGVNLANEKASEDELNSLPQLLGQLLNVLTSPTTAENVKLCNIYVHPDMQGFSSMSFDSESVDELISRGYAAADAQRENFIKLKQLLDKFPASPDKGKKFRKAKSVMTSTIIIDSISIEGYTPAEQQWLLRKMGIKKGEAYQGRVLEEATSLLKGMGLFRNVSFDLSPSIQQDHYNVTYRLEKSESHYLKLGLRFDTKEVVAAFLNFGWNENRIQGFRFGLNAKLSYNPDINVYGSYCAPALVRATFDYNFRKSEYSLWSNGQEIGTRKYNMQMLRLYVSQFRTSPVGFKLGLAAEHYVTSIMYNLDQTGERFSYPSAKFGYLKAFGEFGVNNLDKEYFSTRGIKADVKAEWYFSDFGANKRYDINEKFRGFGTARLRFRSYIPTFDGRFVIAPQVYMRSLFGPSYPIEGGYNELHWSYFGGDIPGRYIEDQLPFIGTNSVQFANNNVAVGRVDFRFNVVGPHYVSLLANGLYSFEFSKIRGGQYVDMTRWGAALRYSLDMPFGPVYVDFLWSNKSQFSYLSGKQSYFGLYLSAGFNF